MRIVAFTAAAAAAGLLTLTAHHVDKSNDAAVSPEATPSCFSGLSRLDEASDEFDEPVGNRWRKYRTGSGDDQGDQQSGELFFRPRMVQHQDGKVRLLIGAEDEEQWNRKGYPAGTIESTFDVPPATADRATCVQVRTKGFAADEVMPDGTEQNVFSAVWLHDRPARHELNPNPEIDIMEFFQKDEAHHALHKWPVAEGAEDPEHVKVDKCRTGLDSEPLGMGDLTQGMHVFGLRREIKTVDGEQVGQLTFYVDGKATWIKQLPAKSAYFTMPRHVILSTQGNPEGEGRPPFPKVATYDWVHAYH